MTPEKQLINSINKAALFTCVTIRANLLHSYLVINEDYTISFDVFSVRAAQNGFYEVFKTYLKVQAKKQIQQIKRTLAKYDK